AAFPPKHEPAQGLNVPYISDHLDLASDSGVDTFDRARPTICSFKGAVSAVRKSLVRKGGLEPPPLAGPDPKSGAAANSATFAEWLIIISFYDLRPLLRSGNFRIFPCVPSV